MPLSPAAQSVVASLDASTRERALYQRLLLGLFVLLLGALGVIGYLVATTDTVSPVVVTIDPTTGLTAVHTAATYVPQATELEAWLAQFAVKHFARRHGRTARDYSDSLLFLDKTLRAPLMASGSPEADALALFIRDGPAANERGIEVRYITFQDRTDPYQASIVFTETVYQGGSRTVLTSTTKVASVTFTRVQTVPRTQIYINPLGLQITDLQLTEAAA